MKMVVYQTVYWSPKGHLSSLQADKLSQLCGRFLPRNVLEIGFCTGRSAAAVLFESKEFLQQMISIDRDLDYMVREGRRMAEILVNQFRRFSIIEGSSKMLLTPEFFRYHFPEGLDWVTVDGDHTYEGCFSDLTAVSPHLNNGGVIIVDDYRSGPPRGVRFDSVTQSVDDFLRKHQGIFTPEVWNSEGKGFCILVKSATSKNA